MLSFWKFKMGQASCNLTAFMMTYISSHKLRNFRWNIFYLCPFFDLEILCWACSLFTFQKLPRQSWCHLTEFFEMLIHISWPKPHNSVWNIFQIMPLIQLGIFVLSLQTFYIISGTTWNNWLQLDRVTWYDDFLIQVA